MDMPRGVHDTKQTAYKFLVAKSEGNRPPGWY